MNRTPRTHRRLAAVLALSWSTLWAIGCGGRERGTAMILVQPEDTILHGLSPGTGPEDVVDGWAVAFDTYVVGLSNVTLARSSGGAAHSESLVQVVEMKTLSPQGEILTELSGLSTGRYDLFSYAAVVPTNDATMIGSVASADLARMKSEGCTYLVRGTMTKPDGESCPPNAPCRPASAIAFDLCVPVVTTYSYCTDTAGLPGLTVSSGSASTASVTIHGDHLFFNGFPGGVEIVVRRAQWLADADTNGDDVVTREELEGITAASGDMAQILPPSLYNLTGGPQGVKLTNAWEYARAQIASQGHFDTEGSCVPVVE